ncbi:MAG: endonuclease/exonuclease/phosphatase [Thermodesulfobacteriota bacterium]
MSKFTTAQWEKVNELLENEGAKYGLPEQRTDSVVLSSFNIRKLGKVKSKSKGSWLFLKSFCERCDLLGIQEVQDNLEGINYLKGIMGDSFNMVASDITGKSPDGGGMSERQAFLYKWQTVERTEVASDLTFDKTAVIDFIADGWDDLKGVFEKYSKAYIKHKKAKAEKKKTKKPEIVLPSFLSFIRTPLCVSFRIKGFNHADPYEFIGVNAHLLFGSKKKFEGKTERDREFDALMKWLTWRAKQADKLYHKNLILFGDLNLNFEQVDTRRDEIEEMIKGYNRKYLRSKRAAKVNFPFLDVHPEREKAGVFRTNARLNQTYDQIGLFMHDKRLPNDKANDNAGKVEGEFNYGMFNFVDLFANALYGNDYNDLPESKKGLLVKKFEHDVSDHMPIWVRLPKPYAGM